VLPLILVFGTKWHFKDVDGFDGALRCPKCDQVRFMKERQAYKAFTLYWWPVWTLEDGDRVVECDRCQTRFEVPPEVAEPDPA
jgi:uncharacterized C2H2 Zn-finger protein